MFKNVAAHSKGWVCGRSFARIEGSNPVGTWMLVSCERRVLSGRGLCIWLITRPEKSKYGVSECGLQPR
jgi:hypothetical protein